MLGSPRGRAEDRPRRRRPKNPSACRTWRCSARITTGRCLPDAMVIWTCGLRRRRRAQPAPAWLSRRRCLDPRSQSCGRSRIAERTLVSVARQGSANGTPWPNAVSSHGSRGQKARAAQGRMMVGSHRARVPVGVAGSVLGPRAWAHGRYRGGRRAVDPAGARRCGAR